MHKKYYKHRTTHYKVELTKHMKTATKYKQIVRPNITQITTSSKNNPNYH